MSEQTRAREGYESASATRAKDPTFDVVYPIMIMAALAELAILLWIMLA